MLKSLIRALFLSFCMSGAGQADETEAFRSPTVLVLGDSQIPFGAGPAFLSFFEEIIARCPPELAAALAPLADMRVAVIGVRSTSVHSWVARSGPAKGTVCDVDPKWKVNAGTFGTVNRTENQYRQIGRGPEYQFCATDQSPFEAMFANGYYAPKLVVLNFLGNSSKRWAESYARTRADIEALNAQWPAGTACVFLTTAPAYTQKITTRRLAAQTHLARALDETNSPCRFVAGLTEATVSANEGNAKHFRRTTSGRVKDPFHPNARAAAHFMTLRRDALCNAVSDQLRGADTEQFAMVYPR